MLVFNAVMCLIIGTLVGDNHTMHSPFIFSLIFVWSRLVPDREMAVWGFPIKSCHLPWVLMVFHLFTGGNPFNDLIGVAAGAIYAYLRAAHRGTFGYGWVDTPAFMHKVVAKLNTIGEKPVERGGGRMAGLNAGNNQSRPTTSSRGATQRSFGGRGTTIGGS